MAAVFGTFIIALIFSLALTPAAKWLGNRLGAVDIPLARKIHSTPIPRSGGLAIFLSFILALIAVSYLSRHGAEHLSMDMRRSFALLGGIVVFGVGFFDDFHRLNYKVKLVGQILAASLAYYGGLRIEVFVFGSSVYHLGIFSYFITVFWFLLLINAMNLIDGLDGLAAGIAFFACFVLAIMVTMRSDYLMAMEFAAFAGALLGFLRYNFNPASIFMGDGGSYITGYTIAALSVLGSIKSSLGTALLIPLLLLGVPIFDTILSPIRRWLLGRKMFHPDKGHIHHQLIEKGISSRKVVLIIYGISFVLCIAGLIVVHLRDATAGIFLVVLLITLFIVVRKLGYLEYLAIDKFLGWFRDLSYEAGIAHGRRSFLNIQIDIERSRDVEEIWENLCQAFEIMDLDRGELHLYQCADKTGQANNSPNFSRIWMSEDKKMENGNSNQGIFYIEIPLMNEKFCLGKLVMMKDVTLNPVQPYTMRRVEYLRLSITTALATISKK
jgi:UDP-GlcNAc:undecaprenyl-phosphate/decaprenyl-phosphate GlcNAc-1-phosphate transferase